MSTHSYFVALAIALFATSLASAQDDPNAVRIPPTTKVGGPAIWAPVEKLEAVLKHWEGLNRPDFSLEKLGDSVEGRGVYAVTMTDPTVPDENKQHALVTAIHAGNERGAPATVMSIIEWFLSSDPLAKDILRNQVVLFLPLVDPDRYVKGQFTPIYTGWNSAGPLKPEEVPESVYVHQIFDRFQPDLHADIHSTSLDFEKYIMFESSAAAYSNNAVRPYHREIIRMMNVAGEEAGYPMDTGESDLERLFYGKGLANLAKKSWYGQPRYYAATYLYEHFHTLISATEVAWEESGLIRHKRLLQVGNDRWPGYYYAGYPNQVIMGNTHATLVSYGETAAARRASRLELWNRFDEFTFGTLDPAMAGQASAFFATSADAETYLNDDKFGPTLEKLSKHPRMDVAALNDFFRDWPAGQNGPTPQLYVTHRVAEKAPAEGQLPPRPAPIAHGASIKLRLPYPNAKLQELQLNGKDIPVSESNGYVTWTARAATYIQVNLPPERLAEDDLFVVTCKYDPNAQRGHWDTWRQFE